MEDRISKAIEDIDNIRNMMEESKVYHLGLAKLSIVYGIYCLLESVTFLCAIYMSQYIYGILILRIIVLVLLICSFAYIYKAERKYTNKYYLSLYGIWAILGIMLPIMFRCSDVLCSMFHIEPAFIAMGLPVDVVLFSVFLLVCAYVTDKRKLIPVSVVILFVYIMLSTVWWDRGVNVPMPMSPDAVLSFSSIYNLLFVRGGYIIMGLYMWRSSRHDD